MTQQHPSDPCSARFIATLFTVGRKRKQPACLPTDEWIIKMWIIKMWYI